MSSDESTPNLPEIVIDEATSRLAVKSTNGYPTSIIGAGRGAEFAWDEFFRGHIRNRHTRAACMHAVNQFLAWSESKRVPLERITPGIIGDYFDQHSGSIPTKKSFTSLLCGLFSMCWSIVTSLS